MSWMCKDTSYSVPEAVASDAYVCKMHGRRVDVGKFSIGDGDPCESGWVREAQYDGSAQLGGDPDALRAASPLLGKPPSCNLCNAYGKTLDPAYFEDIGYGGEFFGGDSSARVKCVYVPSKNMCMSEKRALNNFLDYQGYPCGGEASEAAVEYGSDGASADIGDSQAVERIEVDGTGLVDVLVGDEACETDVALVETGRRVDCARLEGSAVTFARKPFAPRVAVVFADAPGASEAVTVGPNLTAALAGRSVETLQLGLARTSRPAVVSAELS